VDCKLKEFWAITNQEDWEHSVYKVYNRIVAYYTF